MVSVSSLGFIVVGGVLMGVGREKNRGGEVVCNVMIQEDPPHNYLAIFLKNI